MEGVRCFLAVAMAGKRAEGRCTYTGLSRLPATGENDRMSFPREGAQNKREDMGRKRKKQAHHVHNRDVKGIMDQLYVHKENPALVFHRLKMTDDLDTVRRVRKHFSAQTSVFDKFLVGTPIALSVRDIRRSRYTYYCSSATRELDWWTFAFEAFADKINAFVRLRGDYENAFLKADYESASAILDTIESQTGVSLWSLEARFALLEYSQGFEANKRFLSELNESGSADALVALLIDYLSSRAERKMSTDNYLARLQKDLGTIAQYEALASYLQFRLDLLRWKPDLDLAAISYREANFPIVDRYVTFVALCRLSCVKGGDGIAYVQGAMKRLIGVLDDPALECMLQFCDPSHRLRVSEATRSIMSVLDAYTIGDYETTLRESRALLRDRPNVFEFYNIYVRCAGYLGQRPDPPHDRDCLSNAIVRDLDSIYRKAPSADGAPHSILKTAYTLGLSALGIRLVAFQRESSLPDAGFWQKLGAIVAGCPNPIFARAYGDPAKAIRYLENLSFDYPQSVTICTQMAIHKGLLDLSLPQMPREVPETRRVMNQAIVLCSVGEHARALGMLDGIKRMVEQGINGCYLLQDDVLYYMFKSYLELDDLVACTRLVVASYLRNPLLTQRLPLGLLVGRIDASSSPELRREIYYPILYAIFHSKARAVYVAYDNFMDAHGYTAPSQILHLSCFPDDALQAFLGKVCTLDVLACTYHFKGTEAIESERLKLCQYLSSLTIPDKARYIQEISEITERTLIRQGMHQIDEGKIQIDEKGIKVSGESLFKESFNRFLDLSSMNAIQNLRLLEKSNLSLVQLDDKERVTSTPIDVEEIEVLSKTMKIVPLSQFRLFQELFRDIRDVYVFSSEYGLDFYLSLRIRHGALENQIRSPFQYSHLLCEKDKNTGEYLRSPYWDSTLHLPGQQIDVVQSYLKSFSQDLNAITTHLNRDIIQVKTEARNPEGMFDYEFADGELFSLFTEEVVGCGDYETFMDAVFRKLRGRTERNLKAIQSFMLKDISSRIHDRLVQLNEQVRSVTGTLSTWELTSNITTCLTTVQNEFERISRWFALAGAQKMKSFTIDLLISICAASIDNAYPNTISQPVVVNHCHEELDGKYFAPFSDICRTLLGNIAIHSGLPQNELQIGISVTSEGGRLRLEFTNTLSEQVRSADPLRKLNAIREAIKKDQGGEAIKKEGGTGYLKVNKLLKHDLGRRSYDFSFAYAGDDLVVTVEMEMEGLTA